VLEGLMRTVALVACAIVAVSFALFALDETRDASKRSAVAVAGLEGTSNADANPGEERAREHAHGPVREAIDDVDDVLLRPFARVADGAGSTWVRRGVPALLALLVYGLGLPFLARYARGRA
jgi:hypothetical protein